MPYKQIFFDLDHTLWDFETNSKETLEDMFYEFGLHEKGIPDFTTFHQTYIIHNTKMWERFRKGYINRDELRWKRMWLTLLDYKIANDQLVEDISRRYLEALPTKTNLFPDTIEVLDYLTEKKYPLHLITNGFEKTQQQKITHSHIDHYFTYMITSEAAGSLKPNRGIFDYALQKAACRAKDALMIGDALDVDILGAQNAGIDQAYYAPEKPSDGIQPTFYISSLSELKRIL
ncbi:MAG: noncanonical pyrimidine nucleotidase, YjjG family [Chitinophagaceae bacterium]|nr:MAG: noncanonical pyrimidine nucleotidase, YjjG family [Chitinophagaceae bacterium]